MTAKTKIGLPENRKRLQGVGIERTRKAIISSRSDPF